MLCSQIRYTTASCRLGHVLLAADEQGRVGEVAFGDDPRALAARFRAAYPGARGAAPGDRVRACVDRLVEGLSADATPLGPPALPVEPFVGTTFQRRVWARLRTIPVGETRHYGELAAAIGQPRAARAVAQACARNPVAWLVPCHRVTPATGDPGGYRWGPARKRILLALESADASPVPARARVVEARLGAGSDIPWGSDGSTVRV